MIFRRRMKFIMWLAVQIIILFTIGMFFTYLSQLLQSTGFFGDISGIGIGHSEFNVDTDHVWGVRHYWFYWMSLLLFILSIVRIAMWGEWYWSDENPLNIKS